MPSHFRTVSFAIGVFAFCFPFAAAKAQSGTGSHARQLVTQNIDDGKLVELHGNTRPEANAEHDRGAVDDDMVLEHMLLQLRRPAEKEEDLQEFIEELHTAGSRNFHHWISAREFGERFGPSDRDLDRVTDWLERHHFQINVVYPSGLVIDFTGTAGQVRKAFHTEIHHIHVRGEQHVGNTSNPQIPAALSSLVVGIVSLHDFSPHAMHQMHQARHQFTVPNPLGGTDFALAPADLATIYNLNPLFSAGNSGQGQTIALIEDTNVYSLADWTSFRAAFGLSKYTGGKISAVHPAPPSGINNCRNPGIVAPNDAEAILDGEWASAAAPSAAISMVSCKDTNTTFGGLIAVQNLINSKSGPPPIMSISYGQCEAVNGAAANAAYSAAYQQAVAEGVSIFVAAGDSGAAGCDNSVSEATSGIAVNAFASTPYNVAVGGTDFSDTYSGTNSSYWNSTNTSTFGSAISYIPEIPWNDSCAGALVSNFEGYSPTYGSTSLCNDPNIGPFLQTTVGGGGGPSGCATGTPSVKGVVSGTCKGWPKPSWQSVLGNPHDGVRDTPDVSLFAADGLWGHFYVFCWSDLANGGAACTGDPSNWTGAGGTSFASPIMAGIQALINQRAGARQGNPNPTYYQLAATEYGSSGNGSCNSSNGAGASSACVFYDVTLGDMDVNCTGTHNCYLPSGSVGVLSTSNTSFAPAYGTSTGWDFASGIGSVNATNLVNNWPGVAPIQGFLLAATPGSLTLVQGTSGTSTISFAPQGGFSSSVSLSATGLPSGVTASFNPSSTLSTSTLTLSASNTAMSGTATITITGTSGSLTNSTTLTLTVNAAPDFALSVAPGSVSLTQGSSGSSTITVTPQNGFTGSVNLSTSALPGGVNAFLSPSSTTGASKLTFAAGSTSAVGGFTVIVTGTSGSLTHTASVTLTIIAASSPLPQGWWDGDVGVVGPAGSAGYSGGTFTLNASGQWIWDTVDGLNFAYQPLSGDGTIIARLLSLQGSNPSQSFGVMIRETLGPGSAHAYATFAGGSAIYFVERPSTGGMSTYQTNSLVVSFPIWVKLSRSGNNFSVYSSANGVNWSQIGTTQSIPMAQNVFVGLAVCANTNSALATATFDNVSISSAAAPAPNISGISPATGPVGTQVVVTGTGFGASQGASKVTLNGTPVSINSWSATSITITIPSGASSGPMVVTVAPSMTNSNPVTFTVNTQPLPPLWSDLDIGPVGPAGSAGYSNGTFNVSASGQWIWNFADGMNYVYQPLSGDGTIIARLLSLQGSNPSQSFGVMIRETLDPASAHAYATFAGGSAIYFVARPSTGAMSTYQTNSLVVSFPIWVKLSRSGNNFSVYSSTDGVNWAQIGSTQSIPMAQNVFVGLAVCANTNSALATATFDNVSISTVAAPTPTISGISPTTGPVGTQVLISGSGFGTSQGGSVVNLNGAPVTINTWSDTSISVTIPSGGTTGPLVVSVAPSMTNSNPVTFTVTTTALPPQWTDLDIGTVGPAGSASYANGTFTVMGSGNWIWNFADGMNFDYQPLSGDGTITARLLSLQGSNPSQSSGVMIRETLDPASAHAYATYAGGSAIYFIARPSTGAMSTYQTNSLVVSFPIWVKLSRSGNNFSVYSSTDGVNWAQIGTTQSIPMAQNVFVGLPVCSDTNSALATATFDNVSIQ
ncbi:MAG TPA: protease pro-enzyme activation domain-containing protein [Candidatus Acidoferrum sp.]